MVQHNAQCRGDLWSPAGAQSTPLQPDICAYRHMTFLILMTLPQMAVIFLEILMGEKLLQECRKRKNTKKQRHSCPDAGGKVQVLSGAPKQYNPNQIFPVGDGFGLFVYFEKFEDTHFKNGILKRPNSKPRGPRKKKQS